MAERYDPLPDLIEYFVSSRRTLTKAAGQAQGQIMGKLGITADADRSEAAERVRQAVELARECSSAAGQLNGSPCLHAGYAVRDQENLRAEAAEAGEGR